MSQADLETMAKRILDSNRYMTIGTVGGDGHPWVTPVYFTPDRYRQMFWISDPEARHSLNIAARSEVSIVVFDSSVPVGGAEAVYMRAEAEQVSEPTSDDCAAAFRQRFETIMVLTPEELQPPARLRLYSARVTQHWVLIRGSDPVWGRGIDSRIEVQL